MSIESGLSNYYGSVEFIEVNGLYYMHLDDWDDGFNGIEISKEFYDAAVKEFSK